MLHAVRNAGKCDWFIDNQSEIGLRFNNRKEVNFPLPYDLTDKFMGAGWRTPEIHLDPLIRQGMSGFALADTEVVRRGIKCLRNDLKSGEWTITTVITDSDALLMLVIDYCVLYRIKIGESNNRVSHIPIYRKIRYIIFLDT